MRTVFFSSGRIFLYRESATVASDGIWKWGDNWKGVGKTKRAGRKGLSGVGFLGKRSQPPPHQLGGLVSALSFLGGVRGKAPAA